MQINKNFQTSAVQKQVVVASKKRKSDSIASGSSKASPPIASSQETGASEEHIQRLADKSDPISRLSLELLREGTEETGLKDSGFDLPIPQVKTVEIPEPSSNNNSEPFIIDSGIWYPHRFEESQGNINKGRITRE